MSRGHVLCPSRPAHYPTVPFLRKSRLTVNFLKHCTICLVTGLSLAAFTILSVLILVAYLAPAAHAATIETPSAKHPITNVSEGTHEVAHLRTVYVEAITDRYSYVQFNTGAEYLARNCTRPAMRSCVIPSTGTVVLDDGSKVRFAKWIR